MARPHIESRTPEEARERALVIDANVARTLVWLAGSAVGASILIGLWIGLTIQGFDGRIASLEERLAMRDAQIAGLMAADADADRRLTALEVTVTGIGALKERMDQGFADMARRLERMEK